ncbi:MAG: FtsQ-type POTRA domain-containing protein [Bdellovibrionaceae bacterium]|nr:FtsQ-type POTRA domain-containing protein [Pseudobdellovibrionaceae bacterium]
MLRNLVKILFSLVVIPCLVIGSIWYLNEKKFFDLTELNFKTEIARERQTGRSVLENEINLLSKKLDQFKGTSLFEVDLEKMQQAIESENWVKSVEIYREWPNRLKIVIDVYDVVLLYWMNEKKIFPILENNRTLEPLSMAQAPDRAVTVEKKIFEEPKVRKKAIELISSLPTEGSYSSAKISEVGYDSKEGFWTDLLNKELRVKLGNENFESKSLRVSQVLDYIENKQIEARVIDANLSQKVLVRLRKGP